LYAKLYSTYEQASTAPELTFAQTFHKIYNNRKLHMIFCRSHNSSVAGWC